MVTVQTGCAESTSPAESIHLREKNIAGPTERSRKGGEPPLRKLGGQDLRFSMKMMLTPDQEVSCSPSKLLQKMADPILRTCHLSIRHYVAAIKNQSGCLRSKRCRSRPAV